MQCPNCKQETNAETKYCIICGKEFPRCPTCGQVIPSRMQVCPYDGTPLPESVRALMPPEQTGGDPSEVIISKSLKETIAAPVQSGNRIAYCTVCGKAYETDGNVRCPGCRQTLPQPVYPAAPPRPVPQPGPVMPQQRPAAPQQRPMPYANPRPMPQQESSGKSRGLVILLVVLLILAVIAVAVLVLKFVVFDQGDSSDRDRDSVRDTVVEDDDPTQWNGEFRQPDADETETSTQLPTEATAPPETEAPETEAPETTAPPTTEPERELTTYDLEDNQKLAYFIDHCDDEYFSKSYFDGFSEDDACLARNAIFARSGRIFDTGWIREYFERFPWYRPIYTAAQFSNSMLNGYQLENLNVILAYEMEHGY